jgi:hypothetical protein
MTARSLVTLGRCTGHDQSMEVAGTAVSAAPVDSGDRAVGRVRARGRRDIRGCAVVALSRR